MKNKCAAPYKLAEFDILFGSGISSEGCTLDAAEAVGVVSRKGSWYRCGIAFTSFGHGCRQGRYLPACGLTDRQATQNYLMSLNGSELAVCCSYGERRLAQGREKTLAMVQEDKELLRCAGCTHHAIHTAVPVPLTCEPAAGPGCSVSTDTPVASC